MCANPITQTPPTLYGRVRRGSSERGKTARARFKKKQKKQKRVRGTEGKQGWMDGRICGGGERKRYVKRRTALPFLSVSKQLIIEGQRGRGEVGDSVEIQNTPLFISRHAHTHMLKHP